MRHEDLGGLLKLGGDDDGGKVLLRSPEIADHVTAHEKFDLSKQHEQAPVRLRPSLQDRYVEPVLGIGAVNKGLVITPGFRIGEPIGAKGDLVQRVGGARYGNEAG